MTKADPNTSGWAIRDPVIRLRTFGTARTFELGEGSSWLLGTAPDCSIRLQDPSGRVSRRHAEIVRRGDELLVSDLGSTNGIRQDGEPRQAFHLTPGVELELGGIKLVAESERSIALRGLLCRFVGWSDARASEVDHALRAVREMTHLRTTMVIRGEGSLAGFARRIHAQVLDADRPFAVCGNGELGLEALERAAGGMLYLDGDSLPADIEHVALSQRLPDEAVRLVVAANSAEAAAQVASLFQRVAMVWIPPLAERDDELDRVLDAYGADAALQLGAGGPNVRPHDLRWVREGGVQTHEEADEVMLRLVATRNWGVRGGAARFGLTHGAMSRWLRRRKIPT